jgi:hypothetical protein
VNALTNEISVDTEELETEETEQNERDLRPEYCHYKDEGCEYAKSCLDCPFSQCLYDEPRGRQRWLKELRDKEINRLFQQGQNVRELATIFDVSVRTVQRAVNNASPEHDVKNKCEPDGKRGIEKENRKR